MKKLLVLLAVMFIAMPALAIEPSVKDMATYSFERAVKGIPFASQTAYSGVMFGNDETGFPGLTNTDGYSAGIIAQKMVTNAEETNGITNQLIKQTGTVSAEIRPFDSQATDPLSVDLKMEKSNYAWVSGDIAGPVTFAPASWGVVGGNNIGGDSEGSGNVWLIERPIGGNDYSAQIKIDTPSYTGDNNAHLYEAYGGFTANKELKYYPFGTGVQARTSGFANAFGGFDNALQPASHDNEIEISASMNDHTFWSQDTGITEDAPNADDFPWDGTPITWP